MLKESHWRESQEVFLPEHVSYAKEGNVRRKMSEDNSIIKAVARRDFPCNLKSYHSPGSNFFSMKSQERC